MVTGTFTLKDPGEMTAKLTIEMKVKEWITLSEQIGSGWPSGTVKNLIHDLVNTAESVFYKIPEAM